jgi:prophage regulatory protein
MQIMSNDSLIIERATPTILINRAEVLRRTGLKKSTMYGLIRKDKFPHQVQKSENTVGWVEAEIEAWVQEREALRSGPPAKKAKMALRPVPMPPPPALRIDSTQQKVLPMPAPPARLTPQLLKKLTEGATYRLKAFEPEMFFDASTGKLWQCVMQVETQISYGSGNE